MYVWCIDVYFIASYSDAVLSLLDHVNEFITNGEGEGGGEPNKEIGMQDGNGNEIEDQSGTGQMIDRALDSQGQSDTHRCGVCGSVNLV